MPAALVDTGPLVTLFVRNDPDHALVAEIIRTMEKFTDRPMDLADASLVWLAGQAGVREILTLYKGDFATFRTPSGKPFKDLLATARTRR